MMVVHILFAILFGLFGIIVAMTIAGAIVGFRTKVRDRPTIFLAAIYGGFFSGALFANWLLS